MGAQSDDLKSIPFVLGDLTAYADESVVSRTLVKKDVGTVTLFAFAKGQGLSTHSAPFDAFVYVLEGHAEITIDDTPHQVPGGSGIIMPANVPHSVQAVESFKMMLTMIRK